ncbi:MAG: 16S rRNA (guanine(966)-N(2))-methyltransferase RsmD [Planctomycetes bacterium GWF2_42_9]|nr:MAG: 16S rRNA (guanine(966)-N(2))-methyltransferase RsmD [Planctomycetes bacterium GWF2_42_9]HAL44615.1 16S rRNA (guanine(966)-N(2))-methyltransferase RsmD [Phycisphaerales bacterium]
MRIIAGIRRGMNILPPRGSETRPITDRVKESIFDVLFKYNLIEDRYVADLFCGTGSFGLEALSRGAKEAVFVDQDRRAIEVLRQNVAKARFETQAKVVCGNAFRIGAPIGVGKKCSLVFVDPPYEMSMEAGERSRLAGLLTILPEQITEDGMVVVRTEKRVKLLDSYGPLRIIDNRVWGKMSVNFLSLKTE